LELLQKGEKARKNKIQANSPIDSVTTAQQPAIATNQSVVISAINTTILEQWGDDNNSVEVHSCNDVRPHPMIFSDKLDLRSLSAGLDIKV
jgi:hypothetical protein